jgi:hypothetical protein
MTLDEARGHCFVETGLWQLGVDRLIKGPDLELIIKALSLRSPGHF